MDERPNTNEQEYINEQEYMNERINRMIDLQDERKTTAELASTTTCWCRHRTSSTTHSQDHYPCQTAEAAADMAAGSSVDIAAAAGIVAVGKSAGDSLAGSIRQAH